MHAASQLRPRRISISRNTAALFISPCVFSRVALPPCSVSHLFARDRSSTLATSPHAGYKWRHYSLIIQDIVRGVFIVRCARRARVTPSVQHLPDRRPPFFSSTSRTRRSIGPYLLAPWQREPRAHPWHLHRRVKMSDLCRGASRVRRYHLITASVLGN